MARQLCSLLARTALLPLSLAGSACVSQVTYDRAVHEAADAKAAADAHGKEQDGRIHDLEQQLSAAEAATQDRDAKLSDLSTAGHNLQVQLDEQTAMNQQLRGELQRLGKDVDKVLTERGTLSKALDDARVRLDELRKAQAAAEARATLFHDFERRFKPLSDAGQLAVAARRGQLVLLVQGDLLFDVGHAELRPSGKGALMEIARALQVSASPGTTRRYLVTAHVDPQDRPNDRDARGRAESAKPRRPKEARDAWDLSADRAVAIVEYLVSVGVAPESLMAAAAGSFDALAPGDGADARVKNRAVEIALLPSADETMPPAAPKPAAPL